MPHAEEPLLSVTMKACFLLLALWLPPDCLADFAQGMKLYNAEHYGAVRQQFLPSACFMSTSIVSPMLAA